MVEGDNHHLADKLAHDGILRGFGVNDINYRHVVGEKQNVEPFYLWSP